MNENAFFAMGPGLLNVFETMIKCPKSDFAGVPYSVLAPWNYSPVCADEHFSIVSRAWTLDRMIGYVLKHSGPYGRRNHVSVYVRLEDGEEVSYPKPHTQNRVGKVSQLALDPNLGFINPGTWFSRAAGA